MKRLKLASLFPLTMLILAACCTLFLAGCTGTAPFVPEGTGSDDAWRTVELQDVQTGEKFSVASLSGKPIILYTFTVSCPICTLQQKEITALKKSLGESVVVIGLDIDPKEEVDVLKSHIQKNGFSGYYVLSPPEMTGSLMDHFGPVVVNPASAPVMVICHEGSARLLATGIKSSSSLSSSLAVC
ncbi:MAG: redoxin domain-containing protein [Methanolinea sp.]|jgi:cytochrome oxidase Cu insertion factor (SCO1/SenC/PrrC family)|nr:redoxin domain-containing protein [Methanolinea sp.]